MSFVLSTMSILLRWILGWIAEICCHLFNTTGNYIVDWTTQKLVYGILAIAVTIILYYSWAPIDITVDLTEVGYEHLRKKAAKRRRKLSDIIEEENRHRDLGEVPPIYPNGWIPLLESRELGKSHSVSVTALSRQFVIFRGKTGKPFVLDAYCPHLGANLGVKGKVEEDCVVCPFHGWKFSGKDGSCVQIPYSEKVPDFAKIKTWSCCEENGFIFIWHHADGEEPTWYPPIIPEIREGRWNYKGRTQHTAWCHIQEIPENGADVAHFNQIHQASPLSNDTNTFHPTDFYWYLLKHYWQASWEPDPSPHQHMTTMKLINATKICGWSPSFLKASLDVKQIGPALVHLYLTTVLGKAVLVQAITPEGPLQQRIVHHFYTSPFIPKLYAYIILKVEAIMLERDITIWNNKKFVKTPILVSEDKLIVRYRRWYSQFYSKHSPKLNKRTLDW